MDLIDQTTIVTAFINKVVQLELAEQVIRETKQKLLKELHAFAKENNVSIISRVVFSF